jgi:S-adenosylmethionine:tRNA ribosyltransferase-isomerase
MKLSDFDYILPEELIALKPLEKRDGSKLLVFDTSEKIQDKIFKDLPDLLNENDILVLNDTKVIPARLEGTCIGLKAEITLIKKVRSNAEIWEVLANPAKKLIIRKQFMINDDFYAEILERTESGSIVLRFNQSGTKFFESLHKYGTMPLPPYIAKKRKADDTDLSTYQTSYHNNEKEGSVAAPTAGLHFTEELLSKIKAKGVKIAFVTLHVGAGTFLPVRTDDIKDHKMHSEYFEIPEKTISDINEARSKNGRVIAVGTTSLRTLESAVDESGELKAQSGETEIFIYPGYRFKLVDVLVTNFHLPKSTLFMLVSAFIGLDNAKKLYDHAISKKYRFFSYGDGSFLIRNNKL